MSSITTHNEETVFLQKTFDPAFKLFGKTIPVLEADDNNSKPNQAPSTEQPCLQDVGDEAPHSEDESSLPDETGSTNQTDEEKNDSLKSDTQNTCNEGDGIDAETPNGLPSDDSQIDASGDKNMLKKPDKAIPCPRCQSLDTKFCYFNNYNVNQPRHFCKNCQRYWTAGGSLRNVPVGAGRRKSKNSSIQRSNPNDGVFVRSDPAENARQLLSYTGSQPVVLNRSMKKSAVPRQQLPSLDVDSSASFECPPPSTILRFGQETPKVLQGYKPESENIFNRKTEGFSPAPVEKSLETKLHRSQNANCTGNEAVVAAFWPQPQHKGELPAESNEHDHNQAPMSVTANPKVQSSSTDASSASLSYVNPPWPLATNLGWGNMAPMMSMANVSQGAGVQIPCSNPVNVGVNQAVPVVSTSQPQDANAIVQSPWSAAVGNPWLGIPWPFVQNPLWGPAWSGAWTMPWMAPAAAAAAAAAIATATAAAAAASANPGLGNPVAGKRPRDSGDGDDTNTASPLIPKTLRIDDPGDAARSSIWTALGLANKSDSLSSGSIFSGFQLKPENKEKADSNQQTHNLNPAARERAALFQESNLPQKNVDVLDN